MHGTASLASHAVLVHLWSLSGDLSSFRLELASLMVSLIFLKTLKVLAERIRFKKNDLKNYGAINGNRINLLNFASEGFRHKQMLEVFLINSAGRGMKKTWNHGDQALGAAGNTL